MYMYTKEVQGYVCIKMTKKVGTKIDQTLFLFVLKLSNYI